MHDSVSEPIKLLRQFDRFLKKRSDAIGRSEYLKQKTLYLRLSEQFPIGKKINHTIQDHRKVPTCVPSCVAFSTSLNTSGDRNQKSAD